MSSTENKIQTKLFQVINESLALLNQASIKEQKPAESNVPIPSLLDQCIELCEQHHSLTQEPIRMIHHFGLPLDSPLFSSLATIANTRVLKDIHPNNNSFKDSIKSQTLVAKTITANSQAENDLEDGYRIKTFLNDLKQIHQQSSQIGQRIIICDNHCLSQTVEKQVGDLLTLFKHQFVVHSFILLMDPIESYPFYRAQTKAQNSAISFNDYCQSILGFMLENHDLTVIQHEDLVTEPEKIMKQIGEELKLPSCNDFIILREVFYG